MHGSLPHSQKGLALIAICSWVNACLKHVECYSNEYLKFFSDTPILVLDTHLWDLVCPVSSNLRQQIAAAVELIHDKLSALSLCPNVSDPGLNLHIFSKGGCFKACKLAEAYLQKYGRKLPVPAIVLDSTPGKPRYLRHCKGMAKAIMKNRWLQALCVPAAFAVTGTLWIGYMVFTDFANNPMSWIRRAILDFQASNSEIPRPHLFYRFSMEDEIVGFLNIQEHMEKARQRGFSVETCIFNTGHVCHAKDEGNKMKYWSSVHRWWEPDSSLQYVPYLKSVSLIPTQHHRILTPSGQWTVSGTSGHTADD